MATDLAEFLGGTLDLYLLFHIIIVYIEKYVFYKNEIKVNTIKQSQKSLQPLEHNYHSLNVMNRDTFFRRNCEK